MWTIVKFDRNNLKLFKDDLKKKLGQDLKFYCPKLFIEKYKNNKLVRKEYNLLGDYLFCFHKTFKDPNTINSLKFTRGLKYFLNGFTKSQNQIIEFIDKCKQSENKKGYLTQNFYQLTINCKYKFSSGPFTEMIFKIIGLQKNKIRILLGDKKTTIIQNEFLFSPL